jgi:threonylcarbamoyladenosine tRNA methylthiotransferase MtaB
MMSSTRTRSVPAGEVVAQVRQLVEAGHAEIVLTGVDLTSYGPDLPGDMRLGKLVASILRQVPELQRLRLSSIDSIEADPTLMRLLADEERLMPHLHLSLQSGDDMILKRMKRRHLRDDAIRFCTEARRLRPDIVFGADLIAGFPTETEAMFLNSRDLVDACGLTYLHVFPYSPRQGTPAAKMPPVPGTQIKDRAAQLRALGKIRMTAYLSGLVGTSADVLIESDKSGRTRHFAEVDLRDIAANELPPAGRCIRMTIKGVADQRLQGILM